MPQEIERKFLVANDGWRGGADQGRRFRQVYLAETDKAVVRVRIVDGINALLTIKSANPGSSRLEIEYPVPLEDAEALSALGQGSELSKVRFHAPHAGRLWEVDVYSGDNEGLVIAEIELETEEDQFDLPPWVGKEVTDDARYYASRLARTPYKSWRVAEGGKDAVAV